MFLDLKAEGRIQAIIAQLELEESQAESTGAVEHANTTRIVVEFLKSALQNKGAL